ncbi:Golgi Transport [Homalodisca vitripennis]|nr:Golgi Transport [Homalodisca vitripennis]
MEAKLAADDTLNKEYLPVLGLEAAATAATTMLLGADSKPLVEGRNTAQNRLSCIDCSYIHNGTAVLDTRMTHRLRPQSWFNLRFKGGCKVTTPFYSLLPGFFVVLDKL